MDKTPSKRPHRRGSLSLSQTLSFDWTAPPPPADLEQIHATSSQAPGLTSFSLGSPPARSDEPISFNKLYSRVKNTIAGALRDSVGSSASPPTSPIRSYMSGNVGTDQYHTNAASRDSVVSLNTSEGGSDPRSPSKTQFAHLRHPESRSHSRSSSLVSSHSVGGTEFSPPAALRKSGGLGGAPRTNSTQSLAPVTVFRDGMENYDGISSRAPSRNTSTTNLAISFNPAMGNDGMSTVGAFVGPVGNVVGSTSGFKQNSSDNLGGENITSPRTSDPSVYVDVDQESESTSDDTPSDSSDDDVVMLHSKLPAGTSRGPSGGQAAKPATKKSEPTASKARHISNLPTSARASPSLSRVAQSDSFTAADKLRLPPAATADSAMSADPNMLTPGPRPGHPAPSILIGSTLNVGQPSDRLGSRKSLQQNKAAATTNSRPSLMASGTSVQPSSILPRVKSSRTSEHDSSPAASLLNGSTAGQNPTIAWREGFEDRGSTKTASGTHGGGLTGSTEAVSQALRQLRMGNLTRDFWMKDEVCKECFLCGASFTAWRRKHHCRLCGQIFCSKCTTLISGDKFQHQGSMRVCMPCLDVVNDYKDESESEDEFSPFAVYGTPRGESEPQKDPTSPTGYSMPKSLRPQQTPLMAIPATRRTAPNNPNRKSQILEIDAEIPSPPRPTSSRSNHTLSRPVTAGSTKLFGSSALHPHHTHHHAHHHHKHSRSQHRLGGFPNPNERAPFHRQAADDKRSQKSHSAWGAADTVIDPDLAPYMSDEDSDDEQELGIFQKITPHNPIYSSSATNADQSTPTPKEPVPGRGSGSARHRRAKSKSRGSIGGLNAILGEGIKGHQRSTTRRRAQSFIAPLPPRPATRGKNRIMRSLNDSVSSQSPIAPPGPSVPSPRAARGGSSRGPLIPTVELNTASLEHVKKMLRQLLDDAEIKNVDQWERALIPILLKCTDDLNPDVRAGDDIDIRHYVKVKRIPGGKAGDTSYVSGVVFTKNLALKSMSRNIQHPRIAVISFPVEYQRHHMQLMSLEPVIAQEKEFLQNMVNRIIALGPNLLLIESNISGYALQLLAQAKIATAYLVKPSVVEAVARCAQADIFSSIDKLALSTFRLGKCSNFDVKTFVSDEIPGRKKTFMFLSGCQKELGCTIVLRGGDMNTLAVIKQITEMMVYVVYNLKLETCLMRDEFVVIPSSPTGPVDIHRSGSLATLATQQTTQPLMGEEEEKAPDVSAENELGSVAEITKQAEEKAAQSSPTELKSTVPLSDDRLPDDIPNPTYYEDMVRKHETKVLSASPFVSYMQPYLLMRARGLERRLVYLRRLRDSLPPPEDDDSDEIEASITLPRHDAFAEATEKLEAALEQISSDPDVEHTLPIPSFLQEVEDEKAELKNEDQVSEMPPPTPALKVREKFQLVDPQAVHGDVKQNTKKAAEVLRAIYDAEYDKAYHVYETQKKQWEAYLSQYDYLFDPFAHQNIAVLYSMVCTVTSVPCEGPEIRRLEFYSQNDDWLLGGSDCTLGQFVEYLSETAEHPCNSFSCDRKMIQHHRSYVHGQARVSVLVSNEIACPIQGMQNTILMWSYCKRCPNTNTPAIPMSESSWKYSFGKYLELAFWSSEMKMRSGGCPHDLNKDHVRCFGYLGKTVVFQYDAIELLEIVVPRTKITFKPEIDLRIKNEQYTQHEERINRFFNSVKARLAGINIISVPPEKHDDCAKEIETLQAKANMEHTWLIEKLQEKYNKSKYYEIVPLNRALRAVQEKVVEWDAMFNAFDMNYFPSEKDIRRLATLQLKKIFLDNTSNTSLHSDNDPTPEKIEDKTLPHEEQTPPDSMSREQANDVLTSVVEEDQEKEKVGELETESQAMKSDEGVNTITPYMASSQELTDATTTPVQTPTQELFAGAAEMGLTATEKHIIDHTVSLPTSPVTEAAPPTGAVMAELQSRAALESSKRVEKARNPRSSIPVPDKPRRRPPPPIFMGRTVSVPDVRRKELGNSNTDRRSPTVSTKRPERSKTAGDKKMDKFRMTTMSMKAKEKDPVSQIPRSVPPSKRIVPGKDTKVSYLSKHFEQLSKEFERERAREKKQLQAKRARALPVATSRPIVEVYRTVEEAIKEMSDEKLDTESKHEAPTRDTSTLTESSGGTFKTVSPELSRDHTILTQNEPPSATEPAPLSQSQSDVDASDVEMSLASDQEEPITSISDILAPTDNIPLDLKELPHKSWMKMLTNFWAERSASGWTSLDYPLYPTDHVFNDSDIIVREDEPSSLIAFALNGQDYIEKLREIHNSEFESERPASRDDGSPSAHGHHPELERSLLKTTGTHLKYQFQEGTAKMFCKIFYAEQFDALRRNCGVADRYVESLSRCTPWDSKGGKSRSVFLKTPDERIILKSLSPIETAAFINFAPAYFQFMSQAFFHELPTAIAKMLGFYQISIKNPSTGTELKWDILVMENLFYDVRTTRIFDLKGSMRNRYTQSTGSQNEVLLDENMLEFIYESPLFVREHSKKLLRASLWNDTLFLSRLNVMDYSLMIGIDEEKKELVVGIIDCIRTFTWDKRLESWVKEKGLAGGGKSKPTVTSPREYKHRFREAMERYVLEAPSCWHLFREVPLGI